MNKRELKKLQALYDKALEMGTYLEGELKDFKGKSDWDMRVFSLFPYCFRRGRGSLEALNDPELLKVYEYWKNQKVEEPAWATSLNLYFFLSCVGQINLAIQISYQIKMAELVPDLTRKVAAYARERVKKQKQC